MNKCKSIEPLENIVNERLATANESLDDLRTQLIHCRGHEHLHRGSNMRIELDARE